MTQLAAGDRAPEFALPDQNGRTVTLGDLCASTDKGVIVYFYPKACTPGCTKEACDFRDSLEALEAAGYAVVGISPDPQSAQAKFSDRHDLSFPLLSTPVSSARPWWWPLTGAWRWPSTTCEPPVTSSGCAPHWAWTEWSDTSTAAVAAFCYPGLGSVE